MAGGLPAAVNNPIFTLGILFLYSIFIRWRGQVDVVEGLDNAPEALMRLFDGANTGKLLVHVDPLASPPAKL